MSERTSARRGVFRRLTGRWVAILLAIVVAAALAGRLGRNRRPDAPDVAPAATEVQRLEAERDAIARTQEEIQRLTRESLALRDSDAAQADQRAAAAKQRSLELEQQVAAYRGNLARARDRRPDDPVVQWLTGDLLMSVGGAPETVLPYFERAASAGIARPDALAGLARIQYQLNQFDAAYRSASKALDLDPRGSATWQAFAFIALGTAHFDEILSRLMTTFGSAIPEWADPFRQRAGELGEDLAKEQAQQRADAQTDDLPRVRLLIEHQTFETKTGGVPATESSATGRGEVEIELFEDQAPATVANFISLVESRFYDGTRFHWARQAQFVVGGDPNTKNDNPDDDGRGGPGYVIPDEFGLPSARRHFRGTVSMVAMRPHTAGSQFLICLVTCPEFKGRMTAFGRVIRGQEVVDRITPGRTAVQGVNSDRTIPGDLLMRAEVIRKRAHPYRAIRETS